MLKISRQKAKPNQSKTNRTELIDETFASIFVHHEPEVFAREKHNQNQVSINKAYTEIFGKQE